MGKNPSTQFLISLLSKTKYLKFLFQNKTIVLNRKLKQDHINEFVLDDQGVALNKLLTSSDYAKFFSVKDIFQGWLGNCFHIGAMMALTKNEELLEIIIPPDNALRKNMNAGAYHFRFWKLGHWYDIVIDDYLPTYNSSELLFSHNKIYPNEFWVPLFEKAFAK